MSTAVRITYDQFDEMIRRGDFEADDRRFELIYGEIDEMPPPNPPHEDAVDALNEWSILNLPLAEVRVRVQNTLGIPALDSIPLPDLAWVRRDDYSVRRPQVADVLLVIEVSDSSLRKDRARKALLYAEAGVADYWIVNVPGRCLEVLRNPTPTGFANRQVFVPGQEVRPLAFPDIALPDSLIFPD